MGLVMRDGINRFRHAKKYSDMYQSICTTLAWTGWAAGTGALRGADPREMAQADCVVIWGTNPVNTQVNVMSHAVKARKTTRREDRRHRHLQQRHHETGGSSLCACKPGTDGALACAVMHVLPSAMAIADRAFLCQRYTDCPDGTGSASWPRAHPSLGR